MGRLRRLTHVRSDKMVRIDLDGCVCARRALSSGETVQLELQKVEPGSAGPQPAAPPAPRLKEPPHSPAARRLLQGPDPDTSAFLSWISFTVSLVAPPELSLTMCKR
jgi:hypothetical protein